MPRVPRKAEAAAYARDIKKERLPIATFLDCPFMSTRLQFLAIAATAQFSGTTYTLFAMLILSLAACGKEGQVVSSSPPQQVNGKSGEVVATAAPSGRSEHVDLNLNDGTLFTRPLAGLTMDSVTDLLGRPAAVLPPEPAVEGHIQEGNRLLYPLRGVAFTFRRSQEDSRERLSTLTVYLTPQLDKTGVEFLAFQGSISGSIGSDTKAKSIVELYGKDSIDMSLDNLDDLLSGKRRDPYILVLRKGSPVNLTFVYDKATTFVDRVYVAVQLSALPK